MAAASWQGDCGRTSARRRGRVSLRTALSQALRKGMGPAAALVLHSKRDGGVALANAVSTDVQEVEKLLKDEQPEEALQRCSAELLPGLDDDGVPAQRDESARSDRAAAGHRGGRRRRGG